MANADSELIKTLRSKVYSDVMQGKKKQHPIALDFRDINPTFFGSIVVHRPSQFEQLQIGVLTAKLLGDANPMSIDINTGNLAHIISTLDNVTDTKPDWFDVFDPDLEYEILEAVYTEYIEWVNSFRKNRGAGTNTRDSQAADSEARLDDTKDIPSPSN